MEAHSKTQCHGEADGDVAQPPDAEDQAIEHQGRPGRGVLLRHQRPVERDGRPALGGGPQQRDEPGDQGAGFVEYGIRQELQERASITERIVAELGIRVRQEIGFKGDLSIMRSNGGVMSVRLAQEQPVSMMESGPVAGIIGAGRLAALMGIESGRIAKGAAAAGCPDLPARAAIAAT